MNAFPFPAAGALLGLLLLAPLATRLAASPHVGGPAGSQAPSGAQAGDPWQVGQPAPPLRLPTVAGDATVDLASFRGKRVLLIEFASW